MIETKAYFPQGHILNVFDSVALIYIMYNKFEEHRIEVVMLGLNFYW